MTAKLTQQEIDNQIEAAIVRQTNKDTTEPQACNVLYESTSRKIVIEFDNGCKFECPISLLQGVCDLSDNEISQVKLTPAGWGLTWENAEIDLGVNELVQGIFGTKAWMKKIAAKGGCAKSAKKQAASRINGRKGGRPRKVDLSV
jgi:hypothetical protein